MHIDNFMFRHSYCRFIKGRLSRLRVEKTLRAIHVRVYAIQPVRVRISPEKWLFFFPWRIENISSGAINFKSSSASASFRGGSNDNFMDAL